jgi:hypothetical protein
MPAPFLKKIIKNPYEFCATAMITARLTKSFLNFEDKIFFFEIIISWFGILALEENYFLQLSDSVYVAVFLYGFGSVSGYKEGVKEFIIFLRSKAAYG